MPLAGDTHHTNPPAIDFLSRAGALAARTLALVSQLGLFARRPSLKRRWSGLGRSGCSGMGASRPTGMMMERSHGGGLRSLRHLMPIAGGKSHIANGLPGLGQGLMQLLQDARSLKGEGL